MNIPFLDLRAQYLELRQEIDAAVMRVLDSGWYVLGKECEDFECSFRNYLTGDGTGYFVGVNSGTDALRLSLLAAGVGPGDEVITVANTAIPTVAAICSIGAIPIFCDVDPETWLMDPRVIESCVSRKTKAIIAVHLYGGVCDLRALMSVAETYRLALIEDVAQATGSTYYEKFCGTFGNFGAFSFYPSKNLGAFGDGGGIFVASAEVRNLLTMLRNYGQRDRYCADISKGENSRLDEIQAAVLRVKMQLIHRWDGRRKELSEYFRQCIVDAGISVEVQKYYHGVSSVPHLFVIKVPKGQRNDIQAKLANRGVQTLIHYPVPIYRQPAFASFAARGNRIAEKLCDTVLSMPFHQYLNRNEIEYMVDSLSLAVK